MNTKGYKHWMEVQGVASEKYGNLALKQVRFVEMELNTEKGSLSLKGDSLDYGIAF